MINFLFLIIPNCNALKTRLISSIVPAPPGNATKLSDKDKNFFWAYADVEDGGINTGSVMGIRGVPTTIIFKKGEEIDPLQDCLRAGQFLHLS